MYVYECVYVYIYVYVCVCVYIIDLYKYLNEGDREMREDNKYKKLVAI